LVDFLFANRLIDQVISITVFLRENMRSRQLIIIHVIIWAFYFGGIGYYVDVYYYYEAGEENRTLYFVGWCLSRFFDVSFAYFVYIILLQKLLLRNKFWMFSTALVISCFTHFAYDSFIWNWGHWEDFLGSDNLQRKELYGNVVQMLFVALIFCASRNWRNSVFEKEKLEDEVSQTELKFLKSQMSPHFLFNVFNNIYSLSLDKNENTYKAIYQLKSIMKYIQIFESKSEISLSDEESHLRDYIELNSLRHAAKVRLKSSFENPTYTIEPMIFLPFFENAFKHGKTAGNNEIRAYIREKKGVVSFEISNDIDLEKRKDGVSGVGLENIKKRLPYLYSDFWMDVIEGKDRYKVKIRINLEKKVKL